MGLAWSRSVENVSLRTMLNIPRQTHRYFLEPMSKASHDIFSLCARFVKFVNQEQDLISGTFLRKTRIDEIGLSDIRNLRYFEILNGSKWKINSVKECIDHISGFLTVPGFNCSENRRNTRLHLHHNRSIIYIFYIKLW